ncbi:MAG: cytochrome c oxidase accessory protein CcoG [Chlorobiaceae bacterium]|nr:cytochrome c oxidase accessory protein CcoG [Chlorobiaceae bacterium]
MTETETTNSPTSETSFRDQLGIVSKEGKRKWIYSKKPNGKFHTGRILFSWFLLAILFVTPFLRFNGHPIMLFDITERKFIVFGLIFGPHDYILFALAMISAIVFIFLFTVVFGRLFCGWICPQTVFMEMVFRKVDYWIEGGPPQQKRLNESSMTIKKFFKKIFKHGIYFTLSFLIANMLLAWIIGSDKLLKIISATPSEHLGGFIAIVIFTGVFHWIFGWFREQACILVCPYGRLQGVLLDRNSIVIAYDFIRGEPRGKFKKGEERTNGDCIDCHQCVDVCPTGIDIRNGTQLECINCTACIDACDSIMDSVEKPRGLIRYDSIEGIEKKIRTLLTPRSIGYSIVLIILISLLTYLVATRSDIDVTILRTAGMFYQEQPDDYISNLYDVKALNKTFESVPLSFKLKNVDGIISVLGDSLNVKTQESVSAKLFIILKRDQIKSMNTPLQIEILRNGETAQIVETSFLGPVGKKE